MTIGESLAEAVARLEPTVASARFDARALLAALLERSNAWLIAHTDDPLEDGLYVHYRAAVERRAGGEPVPYIFGEAGFYGRSFRVTSDVLVPRPESEALVTLALEEVSRAHAPRELRICDAGTGSGILAITLAAELPHAFVTAIDVSPAALAVAERNARTHGVEERIAFVCGDVRELPVPEPRFHGIVANLPYVASADLAAAPDPTSFEPRLALDGGADGLAVYRSFVKRARAALVPGGWLLMEAGPDTVPALAALARTTFAAEATVRIVRDLARLERVVAVRS